MAEMPFPHAPRSGPSRRAILDAALELVGETGFRRLTIEDIAARAGVRKQTIYRWWSSKSAVVLDAFLDGEEKAARAGGCAAYPDSGDLEADLKAMLRGAVDALNDPGCDAPARALTAESMDDPEFAAEFARKLVEPYLAGYEERLRAAQRAGQVAEGVDVRVALEMITGSLAHRWLLRSGPLTHGYADTVVGLALGGLGRPPG